MYAHVTGVGAWHCSECAQTDPNGERYSGHEGGLSCDTFPVVACGFLKHWCPHRAIMRGIDLEQPLPIKTGCSLIGISIIQNDGSLLRFAILRCCASYDSYVRPVPGNGSMTKQDRLDSFQPWCKEGASQLTLLGSACPLIKMVSPLTLHARFQSLALLQLRIHSHRLTWQRLGQKSHLRNT